MRPSNRSSNELRPINVTLNYTKHAEGSVLIEFGDTKVICTASVIDGVPRFLKGKKQGWLTAEYSMLPRATSTRTDREATRGKQTGRTQEIQRLIGRALRAALDLKKMPDYTIHIDCDVIQADGSTRTAAITGACIAMVEAIKFMRNRKLIKTSPLKNLIAAVSVGIYKKTPVLDLDYAEDSEAETDMNIIMNDNNGFIEAQGTAEGAAFSREEFDQLLDLAQTGIQQLFEKQREVLTL